MYRCPTCGVELVRAQDLHGLHWSCPQCGHQLINIAVLKQLSDPSFINSLWLEARSYGTSDGSDCPACSKRMKTVRREYRQNPLRFDICVDCGTAWLGPQERSALPPPSPPPPDPNDLSRLPSEAAKIIALAEVERIAEEAGPDVPDPAWWEVLPSNFGFPIQMGGESWKRIPWANFGVTLLIVGASLASFHNGRLFQDWGFVPAEWGRFWGFTLLTSFFLHGNWLHLLGNLYFLLMFGLVVEEEVGPWHFLAVLFLSHLAGTLGNYLYEPKAEWTCIGASGGIAGVMLFFAFAFPKRPVLFWGLPVPAVVFMLFWLALQWIHGAIQVRGWEDGIGYYAHLGGGFFGLAYWFFFRKRLNLQWKPKKSLLDML